MDYSHPFTLWVRIPHSPDCVFKQHTHTILDIHRHLSKESESPLTELETPVYWVSDTSLQSHSYWSSDIHTYLQSHRYLNTDMETPVYRVTYIFICLQTLVYRVEGTYIKSQRDLSTELKTRLSKDIDICLLSHRYLSTEYWTPVYSCLLSLRHLYTESEIPVYRIRDACILSLRHHLTESQLLVFRCKHLSSESWKPEHRHGDTCLQSQIHLYRSTDTCI